MSKEEGDTNMEWGTARKNATVLNLFELKVLV
jgi:hypothetical protein